MQSFFLFQAIFGFFTRKTIKESKSQLPSDRAIGGLRFYFETYIFGKICGIFFQFTKVQKFLYVLQIWCLTKSHYFF